MQIYNTPTGPKGPTVIWPQYSSATSCQHYALHLAEIGDRSLLTLSKALLAFHIEDQRNAGPRALLDFLVGITKRQPKLLGK